MIVLRSKLEAKALEALQTLYNLEAETVELQQTRKEFEGDLTLVVFPYLRASRKGPEQTAEEIGHFLQENVEEISAFNVVKGFLNLSISGSFWLEKLGHISKDQNFGIAPQGEESIMVEYSSPNTNKPLHLGHVRNNLLGYSVAEILKAAGKKVTKVQIINDRGIHICKSMVAWQKFGEGETPDSANMKGDHLVGKYYVRFEKELQKEIVTVINEIEKGNFDRFTDEEAQTLQELLKHRKESFQKLKDEESAWKGIEMDNLPLDLEVTLEGALDGNYLWKDVIDQYKKRLENNDVVCEDHHFKKIENALADLINREKKYLKLNSEIKEFVKPKTDILKNARQMLQKWEQGDAETVKLWETMNGWVYKGFEETYARLGVDFDKYYYESDTYLLGKKVVEEGLQKGVFEKDPDGSVWIDLTDEGLDRKILLRSDGTSVYMTQDIGTAIQRFVDFSIDGMIYTVGNEQDYHFKVLFIILDKLGYTWAKNLYHLSYGMVDLPTGKMKSREGTVVDADDLIDQMEETAAKISEELGKTEGMTEEEKKALYHMVGMGALKYYILRVDPKKRMMFNPEESIDFQGNTGPFIQYTHARIKSLLRRGEEMGFSPSDQVGGYSDLQHSERELIKWLAQFPEIVQEAASGHAPSVIANYIYDLVKLYNALYQQLPILTDENKSAVIFRLQLSDSVARVVKTGMRLLGIDVPERM